MLSRTLAMASLEQQRRRPQLAGELPALLAEVSGAEVAAAAATLRPGARARLDLVAGA